MDKKTVVGIYDNLQGAEDAVRQLHSRGFPIRQLSIVTQQLQNEREVQGFVTTGDIAKGAAGTGAWFGGLFGLLIGAAFLWVPGVGPLVVPGPLASALLGSVEGALGGAVIGALLGILIGWGVNKDHILKYQEKMNGGKHLVVVNGAFDDADTACSIVNCTAFDDLQTLTPSEVEPSSVEPGQRAYDLDRTTKPLP